MSFPDLAGRSRSPRRLLVTGASGLLGLNMALDASRQGYAVTGVVNSHRLSGTPFEVRAVDLANLSCLPSLLDETRPDLVVHCAAMAILDTCEANPRLAEIINARLPGILADETGRRGIKLIHISTDAIFDGSRDRYKEEDQPNPLGVYARTKLAGEQAVRATNSQALVARVNFYGWSLYGQRSLAEFFFTNLSTGRQVKGFTDVFFCPLLVNDLGQLLLEMAERNLAGIYHVASSECVSKYEFGVRVARQFGLDPALVSPASVIEGNLIARRASNLHIDTSKVARALGAPPPGLGVGLQKFHQQYKEGYPQALALLRG
jgi:dTDP-4-dehydrorhamnose reductase